MTRLVLIGQPDRYGCLVSGSPLQLAPAERWLSPHRLQVYLAQTGGDVQRALALYEWNAEVAAACMRDVGHFEVLVRNHYNEAFVRVHPQWTQENAPVWHLENGIQSTRVAQRKANSRSRRDLHSAREHAPRPTPGHVVANLMFGFWTALTRPERESTIWTPFLRTVFPGETRGYVNDRMVKLNHFRNRLAHWEPIFSTTTGLVRQLREFDEIFNKLDRDVALWVGQRSTVVDLIDEAPEPSFRFLIGSYLGVVD